MIQSENRFVKSILKKELVLILKQEIKVIKHFIDLGTGLVDTKFLRFFETGFHPFYYYYGYQMTFF